MAASAQVKCRVLAAHGLGLLPIAFSQACVLEAAINGSQQAFGKFGSQQVCSNWVKTGVDARTVGSWGLYRQSWVVRQVVGEEGMTRHSWLIALSSSLCWPVLSAEGNWVFRQMLSNAREELHCVDCLVG